MKTQTWEEQKQEKTIESIPANSLTVRRPELAAQLHPTKNLLIDLETIGDDYPIPVWWECEQGHSWRAKISDRISGTSECPYCSNRKACPGFNDLETVAPEIAAQWHPSLNGTLRPGKVTANSKKRVWWKCQRGHVWRATICSRTEKSGRITCPVCNGTIKDIGGMHL